VLGLAVAAEVADMPTRFTCQLALVLEAAVLGTPPPWRPEMIFGGFNFAVG
jgi:hypothetical protein